MTSRKQPTEILDETDDDASGQPPSSRSGGAGRYTAIAVAGVEVELAVLTRAKAQSFNRSSACYEPAFTEPHVRWGGRTAGEIPHPT